MNGIWEDHVLMLEDKLRHAREIVRETEAALYKARLKVAGLAPGCTVRSTKDGQLYRFAKAWSFSFEKPWIRANPMKKDGSWGLNERNLYGDWEIKRAPDAAQDDARA